MVTLNAPSLRVDVSVYAGIATRLRVWLSDGVTEATITSPQGIGAMQQVTLYATKPGRFALSASVEDLCGRKDQTGLSRLVDVQ